MKKTVTIFLLILIILSGCEKKNQRTLNVLNWSSYIPDEIILAFQEETGIKVNYQTYSSNEELLAKISSVSEGTYDLIFPSDYMVEIMIKRDMLEKIDKKRLENIWNLNPEYLGLEYDEENTYTLPFLAATSLIAVNTKYVKEDITSYNDLLNSKYKNEIVLLDDQRIMIGMALLACGYDMNSTNEKELKEAQKWLEKLKPNIKAYDSDSPKNFLLNEEASIGVIWNAEAALAHDMNNDIITIFPKEGFALSFDNYAIPKGAKNIDELYEFIDYILRADVMAQIVESYPYKTVNKESEKYLSHEYLTNSAANINDQTMKNGYFVKNIGSSIKLYDTVWINIK